MLINTPPMGFNTWNTFGENIDEKMIFEIADMLVESGLKDCGYNYLVIDDCWSERERDENKRLVPSKKKFPNGMKHVSDYVHSKGLKFGMYSCCGNLTCAGYPSSFNFEFIDAKTFAEWGVDFLKYDYCNRPYSVPGEVLYRRMGAALSNCGRDILFSACNWGSDSSENWIGTTGSDMWRSTGDINDSWVSIKTLHEMQIRLQPYAKKGCFNDMDMLTVGMNGKGNVGLTGCTNTEYKTHFSLWAFLGSPLMVGCDIRTMDHDTKKILTNKAIIEINQDPALRQPYLCKCSNWDSGITSDGYSWVKLLSNGDYAIGLFNMGDNTMPISVSMFDIGLGVSSGKTLQLHELWTDDDELITNEIILKNVPAHDCLIYRCKVVDR